MKYSIRYNLMQKKGTSTDGRAYIFLRISWAGKRVSLLTGLQVLPEYWDNDEQRVRSAYRFLADTGASINKQLSSITAHFDNYFSRCHIEQTTPSSANLRHEADIFFGVEKRETDVPFFECLDIFMKDMSLQNGWSDGTLVKLRTIKHHLYSFAPHLEFSDLNDDGLQLFLRHLMKQGLRNTTIEKDIDVLRWFLRWALKKGYTDNRAFETFRPKLKGTDGNAKEVIYLDWDELIRLFDYDFGERHSGLAAVRDVFCFCCFTGLRYSDAAKLKLSDIKENYISVVTQKTTDGLRIELNDFSRAILQRCEPFQKSDNNKKSLALPVISNQKMNDYLKDIGRILEFDEPIRIVYYKGNIRHEEVHPKYELLTSHCARRTFVVNALRLGIPAEVIMKWTGHSDFKSMKPYVKIVDELKEQEMAKFNNMANRLP